jgi:tetratricopeptide (TPR) repeat protein
LADAEVHFRRAIELSSRPRERFVARHNLGRTLYYQQRFSELLTLAENMAIDAGKATEYRQQESADSHMVMAYAYLELGNLGEAQAEFAEVVRIGTSRPTLSNLLADAYNGRGNTFMLQREYTRAINDHMKALEFAYDGQNHFAIHASYASLGDCYFRRATLALNNRQNLRQTGEGFLNQAIKWLEKAIRVAEIANVGNHASHVHSNLSRAYSRAGRLAEAAAQAKIAYERAMVIGTNKLSLRESFRAYVEMYTTRGQAELAAQVMQESLERLPPDQNEILQKELKAFFGTR